MLFRSDRLGSLVLAAKACYDAAMALGTPFISGKDSLNNEFRPEGAERPIAIPPSLLISAMGMVDDVATCVTMDLKESGNYLYIVGLTDNELGGSHFNLVESLEGGQVPRLNAELAKDIYAAVHEVIAAGLVRACHDLSEGGLAAAAAEMAFAGGLGARIMLDHVPYPMEDPADVMPTAALLFGESNTRFLIEVREENVEAFQDLLEQVPLSMVGNVVDSGKLEITDIDGSTVINADLETLKEAWQKPLRW